VLKKASSYSTLFPFLASVAPNSLPPFEPLPTPKTKTHHPIAIDQNHTKKVALDFDRVALFTTIIFCFKNHGG
jgi:hypothetical protein